MQFTTRLNLKLSLMGALVKKNQHAPSQKIVRTNGVSSFNSATLNVKVWTKEEVEKNRSAAYKYVL